jgi:hypothetical protein
MGTRTGAVIAIAVVAAVSGALVVRQNAAIAQQRDAEQAQLQATIRQLEADKQQVEQAQRVEEDKKPDGSHFTGARTVAFPGKTVASPKLQTKTPRWEYRVLTLAERDELANQKESKCQVYFPIDVAKGTIVLLFLTVTTEAMCLQFSCKRNLSRKIRESSSRKPFLTISSAAVGSHVNSTFIRSSPTEAECLLPARNVMSRLPSGCTRCRIMHPFRASVRSLSS